MYLISRSSQEYVTAVLPVIPVHPILTHSGQFLLHAVLPSW